MYQLGFFFLTARHWKLNWNSFDCKRLLVTESAEVIYASELVVLTHHWGPTPFWLPIPRWVSQVALGPCSVASMTMGFLVHTQQHPFSLHIPRFMRCTLTGCFGHMSQGEKWVDWFNTTQSPHWNSGPAGGEEVIFLLASRQSGGRIITHRKMQP